MSFLHECPSGYKCAHSNVENMHICCRMTIDQSTNIITPYNNIQSYSGNPAFTFRPPVDEITCPIGYLAYKFKFK